MKKVAIVLSGSGVFDGSEIREAVLALLGVEKAGASAEFFAPNVNQRVHINHLTGEADESPRNVLVESARIARGKIRDLTEFDSKDFDALVFPGGFGAAQTLSSFAFDGADCKVLEGVKKAAASMFEAGKPVGFLCISPVIAAKLFGDKKVVVTIGKDKATAQAVEAMGAVHRECEADDFVKDPAHNLYTTPAYMLEADMPTLEKGISKMIAAMLK